MQLPSAASMAVTSCNHLACLSSDLLGIPPIDTPCNRCQDGSNNLLCLCCKEVLCGNSPNNHMLQHYQETNHCLVLGYRRSDISIYCYSCTQFLDPHAIFKLLRAYETAYNMKFKKPPPFIAAASQTPPMQHINTEISSLGARIEELVAHHDKRLCLMKNEMDRHHSELLCAEIDRLRTDLRKSEADILALTENQHEEIKADLRRTEDRMRALAEIQHKEIIAYLRSNFFPPQPPAKP